MARLVGLVTALTLLLASSAPAATDTRPYKHPPRRSPGSPSMSATAIPPASTPTWSRL